MTWLPLADLKKFLKKNATGSSLGVADAKLGSIIKEKLGIPCIYRCARSSFPDTLRWQCYQECQGQLCAPSLLCSNGVQELARGVRSQLEGLVRCGWSCLGVSRGSLLIIPLEGACQCAAAE